jgi:acyl-CoA reductase-like NAD-dependent aldehyde dehydrogenase
MITPWNNPVAIPVGKLGPALAFGNGVVWKAANRASCTSRLVVETLMQAGPARGLVNLLFGGAETARQLIRQSEVEGISLTGSCTTGREVAGLCAAFPKPLQAELGGNNAAIVMPDGDLKKAARELTIAAFSFSGQRCTATRRFLVHEAVRNRFEETLLSCIRSLRLGDPADPGTDVGPVISREKQSMLRDLVEETSAKGAKLLCGGKVPAEWDFGCWFEPTLFDARDSALRVVQEETFGPIAVLQTVRDLTEALQRLNGVDHGLAASLYSYDPEDQHRFLEEAKCGTLKLNQPTLGVGPEAAFGGWKGSGLGPPEHGIWDRDFYTRPQALYGWK